MSKKVVDYASTAPGRLMEARVERMGYALLILDSWEGREVAQGVHVTELRVRLPSEERPECLVVVKGIKDGVHMVGFHTGLEASDTLRGAIMRVGNGTMVWRSEKPYVYKDEDILVAE